MKFIIITCCALFIVTSVSAQDTTYYYASDFGITNDKETAKYRRDVNYRFAGRKEIITYQLEQGEWLRIRKDKIIPRNDTLLLIKRRTESIWSDRIQRVHHPAENGLFYFRDKKGRNLLMEGTASSLVPLHIQDTLRTYYEKNKLKSIAIYDENQLVSNQYWLPTGEKYYDNLHHFVDKEPEHNLGNVHFRAYMLQGIEESKIDLTQISDQVVVGWVIMKDGSTAGFHTISGVYSQLNKTLIQLIQQMPGEWQPAMLDGNPVRYYMKLPFNFSAEVDYMDNLEIRGGILFYD